jgi:hypothetical protein
MIRTQYRDGKFCPIDPVPLDIVEGGVYESSFEPSPEPWTDEQWEEWLAGFDALPALPPEDDERLSAAVRAIRDEFREIDSARRIEPVE